jgi:acyl carrier protein
MTYVLATSEAEVDAAVWAKVHTAFAEALGLELDEVSFDSRIISDLDAESLDFLDVAFRLERGFDIKIPRGGIEQAAREGVGEEAYEVDGVLTAHALAGLADALPEIPRAEFAEGLKTIHVPELFRVGTFYNLVVRLLNEKSAGLQAAS